MSNDDVWGHGGSSNPAPNHNGRKKVSPAGIAVLVLGAVGVLVGAAWKVFFTSAAPAIGENGNDFSGADLPMLLVIVGFVLILLGGWIINKARKNQRFGR